MQWLEKYQKLQSVIFKTQQTFTFYFSFKFTNGNFEALPEVSLSRELDHFIYYSILAKNGLSFGVSMHCREAKVPVHILFIQKWDQKKFQWEPIVFFQFIYPRLIFQK